MSELKDAACVLIQRGDKFLAISRRDNSSLWGLPGGKVDPGETAVQAAIRELQEETGLVRETRSLLAVISAVCPGEVGYFVTTFRLLGDIEDRELQAEAGMTLGWKTKEELCDETISPFASYNRQIFEDTSELPGTISD